MKSLNLNMQLCVASTSPFTGFSVWNLYVPLCTFYLPQKCLYATIIYVVVSHVDLKFFNLAVKLAKLS